MKVIIIGGGAAGMMACISRQQNVETMFPYMKKMKN